MKTIRLLAVIGILLFYSCIKEDTVPTPQGNQVAIWVSSGLPSGGGTRADGDPDSEVQQFRILAFKTDGTLALNEVTDISRTTPYKIEIVTGTYDFVFVGNEDYETPAKSQLTSQFELLVPGSSGFSDFEALSFPFKAFDNSIRIPMSRHIKNVEILDNNRYIIDGVEHNGDWTVTLKRLAVRLDLEITTENPVKSAAFKELQITNVPTKVPILETNSAGNKIYNGGAGNYVTIPVVIDAGSGFEASGSIFKWTAKRVVLPSSVFTPDNEGNALTLQCVYNGLESATTALQTNVTEGDYQLPRNTHFKANMVISPTFEMFVETQDWDNILIDNPAGSNKTLNISAIKASINDRNMARIWFSSNQPDVVVDDFFVGTTERVNSVLNDLAGQTAQNFHYTYNYETGEGSGYMDIMTSDGNNEYYNTLFGKKIYLNAGGLKREIEISPIIISGAKIGYFEYVGAFWRNDQTGERLISGRNRTVGWKAEILEGKEWVKVATGKSLDPNVWLDGVEPGDAEDYQVEGNESAVSGSGAIFFRIGLKSKQPIGTAPRYGLIEITYTGGNYDPSYIYLRQGEEADYLMRPQDPGTSTTGTTSWGNPDPRPLAAKFLPYNVTSPTYFTSHYTTLQARREQLTEFPTQAGTFFQWAYSPASSSARAYHPVIPNSGSASGWVSNNTNIQNAWSSYRGTQETCPPGYRRPHNGSMADIVTSTYISNSEISQSLWTDPTSISSSGSVENVLFGYYADGFFDRRLVKDAVSTTSQGIWCMVSGNNMYAAYTGSLFYNPTTLASLFFPMPGYRFDTGGVLWSAGLSSYYWTGTGSTTSGHMLNLWTIATPSSSGWITAKAFNRAYINTNTTKASGANVRCVQGSYD